MRPIIGSRPAIRGDSDGAIIGTAMAEVAGQTGLEGEVAQLIVDAVGLDLPAAEIDPGLPLFGPVSYTHLTLPTKA